MKTYVGHTVINKEQTIELLRQYHITPTQQRVDIALLILARHQHFAADDLLQTLNKDNPVVSKATIYNTLSLFVEKGLIRQVIVDPTKVFYDSNTLPHQHFYNIDSGELTDIENDDLSLAYFPNLPKGTCSAGLDIIIKVRNAL
ncbi:Fur family transcriptional regulator [Beggiatoa leptomitoformis]|uniref:Ferric uptake regulation protein n=1 Tax=Beggiatoa leptomitoformis TaxID=288004 RepID=A0A2N9YIG8_9GAMM|nr:transcriptional repressor [Beggiatoa leptomitoformis]ALG67484.1 transcriptional repressor [Beggiatoa leptomitoformis]AUI70294.1 transcriptional repressor [Beggiatoa leptomitoformis]